MALIDPTRGSSTALGAFYGSSLKPPTSAISTLKAPSDVGGVAAVGLANKRNADSFAPGALGGDPVLGQLSGARRAGTSALAANEDIKEQAQRLRRALDLATREQVQQDQLAAQRVEARQRVEDIQERIRQSAADSANLLDGSRPNGVSVRVREVPEGEDQKDRPSQDEIVLKADDVRQLAVEAQVAFDGLIAGDRASEDRLRAVLSSLDDRLERNRISLQAGLKQVTAEENRRLQETEPRDEAFASLDLAEQLRNDAEKLRDLLKSATSASTNYSALSVQSDPRAPALNNKRDEDNKA